MDAAWATVTGVVVTFAGSALVPWVRDSLERKRSQAAAKAKARNEALGELLTAALEHERLGADVFPVRLAAARLYLQLEPSSELAADVRHLASGNDPIFVHDVLELVGLMQSEVMAKGPSSK